MPYSYLIIVIAVCDQILKVLIQTKIGPLGSVPLLPGRFSLTFVANYGAAFGMMQYRTWLLQAITLGTFGFAWVNRKAIRMYPQIFQIGVAVALGGALGNFIDRLRLGYVIDFLDFYIWPVFNLADIAIIGGAGLIVLGIWRKETLIKRQRLLKGDPRGQFYEEEEK